MSMRSGIALVNVGVRGLHSKLALLQTEMLANGIVRRRIYSKPSQLLLYRCHSSHKDNDKKPLSIATGTHIIDKNATSSNEKGGSTVSSASQSKDAKNPTSTAGNKVKASLNPQGVAPSATGTTLQQLGSTLHAAGTTLEELEKNLMQQLNENNKRRFRTYLLGGIAGVITIIVFFGRRIRKVVTDQTADFASETLGNESLKIQTQELAFAVVQTILNDKEITAHAASFLKEASTAQETQLALLELVLHVLQHPQTIVEVKAMAIKLIFQLADDKEVQLKLLSLFADIMQDPTFRTTLSQTIVMILQDPKILQAVTEMVVKVSQQNEVTDATTSLLQSSAMEVLVDEEILEESRKFAGDVMGDDRLQKEGGDAIWKSLHYALQPGIIRLTGIGLIALSIGAFRLFISPF